MFYKPLSLVDVMRKQNTPPHPSSGWMLVAILAALAMLTRDAETEWDWVLLTIGWTAAILYSAWLVYRTVRSNQQGER